MTDDTTSLVKELFFQRTDDFPIQQEDGTYRRAGRALTDDDIRKHLSGEITLGSYTIGVDNKVRWICWDFDGETHRQEAKKLFDYLQQKEPYKNSCAIEVTGGRGTHLWLFVEPIDAKVAYTLGRRIKNTLGFKCEVFPKQPKISNNGFGNLVKVPFGKHRKYGGESFFVEPDNLNQIKPAKIPEEIAEAIVNSGEKPDITFEFIPWSGCQAFFAIGQGVGEGERNEAGFFRGRVMFSAGLTRDETEAALKVWNEKNHPPMSEQELKTIVDSLYRKRKYTVGSWSIKKHPILSHYCEGCVNRVCEIYSKKRKIHETKKSKFRHLRLI